MFESPSHKLNSVTIRSWSGEKEFKCNDISLDNNANKVRNCSFPIPKNLNFDEFPSMLEDIRLKKECEERDLSDSSSSSVLTGYEYSEDDFEEADQSSSRSSCMEHDLRDQDSTDHSSCEDLEHRDQTASFHPGKSEQNAPDSFHPTFSAFHLDQEKEHAHGRAPQPISNLILNPSGWITNDHDSPHANAREVDVENQHFLTATYGNHDEESYDTTDDISDGQREQPQWRKMAIDKQNSKEENIQTANNKHREWLSKQNDMVKIQRETEKRYREQQKYEEEKRRRHRDELVQNYQARRDGGFDAPTALAEAKIIKKEKIEEIPPEERDRIEHEKLEHMRKVRRRHKQKLKEKLKAIKKTQRDEAKAVSDATQKSNEMRQRLKESVLAKMRKERSADVSGEFSEYHEKNEGQHMHCTPKKLMSEEKEQNEPIGIDSKGTNSFRKKSQPGASHDDGVTNKNHKSPLESKKPGLQALKYQCLSQIATIQKNRAHKEDAAVKLQKRLQKRASILRSKVFQGQNKENELYGNAESESESESSPHSMKKISLEDAAALGSRLSKRNGQDQIFSPAAQNYSDWKRKNGVDDNQKVFCLTGWYPSIKADLLKRGWFYNPDRESPYFDLKWTLSSSDIDFMGLLPNQAVNHFQKSNSLTTKTGLLQTLKNLSFMVTVDENSIFPRSYDLSLESNVQTFIEDFHYLQAESITKTLLEKVNNIKNSGETSQNDNPSENSGSDQYDIQINPAVFDIIIEILQKRRNIMEGPFLDDPRAPHIQKITDIESEILLRAEKWLYCRVPTTCSQDHFFTMDTLPKSIDAFLQGRKGKKETSAEEERTLSRKLARKLEKRKQFGARLGQMRSLECRDVKRATEALSCMSTSSNEYQNTINGKITKNIWVVKPGGKSRGRDISIHNNIDNILDRAKDVSKSTQWVVQKYIENPLTIADRKFDIRQWVLVTDWNPLTIWFYDDCYIRFAVEKYMDTSENPEGGMDDLWVSESHRHLVNNSISKNSSKFHDFLVAENGAVVSEYIWPLSDFKSWVEHQTGEDKWTASLLPQIKDIVWQTLACAQSTVVGKKKSWELFGYDIMIDDEYHPWLIEINSSPACDYSTAVTENFVKRALPDILKVVLDNTKDGEASLKGGWELIHQGNEIPPVLSSLGMDLALKGEKIVKNMKTAKKKKENVAVAEEKRLNEGLCRLDEFDDSDLSDYDKKKERKATTSFTGVDKKDEREVPKIKKSQSYRFVSKGNNRQKTACLETAKKEMKSIPVRTMSLFDLEE